MRRIGILLVVLAVVSTMSVIGVGCKEESTTETAEESLEESVEEAEEVEEEKEKLTFAVIPCQLGHPWWVRCEFGASKFSEDYEVEIIFTAPDKEDAAKQLDIFNDMVNRGVDAIIMAAVDADVMKKPISDAIEEGIPVFGFDIGVPGADTIYLASGFEPVTSGTNIAKGLVEEINGSGKVAILIGSLGSPILDARQKAIEETLAEYPDIEVVGVYANDNDYEKGLAQCESILQAHPDLAGFAGVVATNIPTASKAIINAGLEGELSVWGAGLPTENAEYIKAGIAKMFTLDAAKMTYIGCAVAYDYITENKLPQPGDSFGWGGEATVDTETKTVYAPDVLVTPENVDDFEY